MEKYVGGIQEALREQFPRFRRGLIQEVRLGLETPKAILSERYEFQNRDATVGIIVAPDFVTVHTSSYQTYEVMEETLRIALDAVHDTVRIGLSERIGLRYVDLIRPAQGESLRDYLNPQLLGFDAEGLGAPSGLNRLEFLGSTSLGTLIARCTQQSGQFLPPDLWPSSLSHKIDVSPTDILTLLDFDHYTQRSMDFELSAVLDTLGGLHDTLDGTFRSSVTERALDRWERENVTD